MDGGQCVTRGTGGPRQPWRAGGPWGAGGPRRSEVSACGGRSSKHASAEKSAFFRPVPGADENQVRTKRHLQCNRFFDSLPIWFATTTREFDRGPDLSCDRLIDRSLPYKHEITNNYEGTFLLGIYCIWNFVLLKVTWEYLIKIKHMSLRNTSVYNKQKKNVSISNIYFT